MSFHVSHQLSTRSSTGSLQLTETVILLRCMMFMMLRVMPAGCIVVLLSLVVVSLPKPSSHYKQKAMSHCPLLSFTHHSEVTNAGFESTLAASDTISNGTLFVDNMKDGCDRDLDIQDSNSHCVLLVWRMLLFMY
jgi:hypothetical protein